MAGSFRASKSPIGRKSLSTVSLARALGVEARTAPELKLDRNDLRRKLFPLRELYRGTKSCLYWQLTQAFGNQTVSLDTPKTSKYLRRGALSESRSAPRR